MNGAGWLLATSNEVMKMKAINHKPMIRPKGTLTLQCRKEVRVYNINDEFNGYFELFGYLSNDR